MRRMCAWCSRFLGVCAPYLDVRTSHGICESCLDRYFPDMGISVEVVDVYEETAQTLWGPVPIGGSS